MLDELIEMLNMHNSVIMMVFINGITSFIPFLTMVHASCEIKNFAKILMMTPYTK